MTDVEERLRKILHKIADEQSYENYNVQIQPIDTGGANHTSRLFTATVSAPGNPDLKLFAKVAILGEKIREISSTPIFEVEKLFYTKIIQKYKHLEERHNVPTQERLVFPKYYGGTTECMKEILVIEDLTHQGYKSFDRMKCYDWHYASECLAILAKLHALSVAYKHEDPDDFAKMVEILRFEFPVNFISHYLEKSVATAIKHTEEIYKQRVEKFLQIHLQKQSFFKFFKPNRTVVLQHGDFRPSNILQKIDKDGKLQLVIVDHQLFQLGNPVFDLLYFLVTNSDEEFRAKHLHQYFDHYHLQFRKALSRFGIDSDEVYARKEIDEDVKEVITEVLPFGLMLGALWLPIITVDESKAPKNPNTFELETLDMEISDQFAIRFNGLVRDYIKMGLI